MVDLGPTLMFRGYFFLIQSLQTHQRRFSLLISFHIGLFHQAYTKTSHSETVLILTIYIAYKEHTHNKHMRKLSIG